jgi:hypothetical protein
VLIALVCLLVPMPGLAQEADGYTLQLPDGWERVEYKDGASIGRIEYIFKDRSQGLLKIRRLRVAPETAPAQLAQQDMDGRLSYMPGYARGRTETFSGGALKEGALLQFDFTNGGKPMLGRNYYLRGDQTTVWVLQFTGDRSVLGTIRNVTDQMARGFRQQ